MRVATARQKYGRSDSHEAANGNARAARLHELQRFMTRVLLFLLFFVMLAADTLGLNLSLAPGLSVKNLFLYMIFAGIAVETALKRNRQMELQSVIIPYSLCFLYAAFSIVVIVLLIDYSGYRPLKSIINLKGGMADNLLILLVFFYGILSLKDAVWLIKAMVWIVIVANLVTVIDAFNLPDLGLIDERLDGRVGGPIGESNQYAAFLALFLPASIALVLIERGALRVFAALGVAVSLLALLMTASRGGFVGIIGGSAIAAVLLRQYISARVVLTAVGAIGVMAVLAVGVVSLAGYGDLLYDRFIGESVGGTKFTVSSGRTHIWATALNKMMEQPVSLITGYGWDTYFQFRSFRFAPHNSYLKIFFELGLIGLLLMLFALVNILRIARSGLQRAEAESTVLLFGFIFGLSGILVAIFFVDITTPWLFIWAFVGTTMRLAVLQFDPREFVVREGSRSTIPDRDMRLV